MDVQAILAEVDRDGDGNIDYDEFVAMMMKVRLRGPLTCHPFRPATLRLEPGFPPMLSPSASLHVQPVKP